MKHPAAIALCTLSLAACAAGCGVNEDLYNATVKDRDAQKAKLAETEEQLAHEAEPDAARGLRREAVILDDMGRRKRML